MFILFASVFSAAFTTTQPTMDYDASNVPCPMREKTRPGMYKDDEYFKPFDGDYDDIVDDYYDELGDYEYYDDIGDYEYYDDIGDYDYNDNKLPAGEISYYYKNIMELFGVNYPQQYIQKSTDNEVVKNVIDTLPDTIFTINSLIQQLQHKINVLSSYIH